MATPVVALGVDGVWYDVAALQASWGLSPVVGSNEFHTRVIAARCLGLHEIDARLRAGPRPRSARLHEAEMLLLPPCDTDGASFFELAPYALRGEEPHWVRGDVRTLVGDGQPVPLPHGRSPSVQVALAVVVADELWRATAREAAAAIAGVTLQIQWGADAPSSLGPALLVGRSVRDLAPLTLQVRANSGTTAAAVGTWPFQPAESLAYISQTAPLRPGDVISLGGALPEAIPARMSERVSLKLPPFMQLGGWPTEGPPAIDWRLRR